MKMAIDDGSTNVKVSWIENKVLKTIISPNSFRKDWKSAALRKDKKIYNYEIGNTKYTYDATSDKSLATTHVEYQYDDLNLLSVHHALLQTCVTPCDVAITVTLPITEFYNPDDCQRNEEKIEKKRRNLMRAISLNKGELFNIVSVEVMPESLPAALSRLIGSGCNEFTKTLVIDCGGTTLDMGIIVGEFDDVSDVYGNNEIGVSMVTDAVRKALAAADSDSSYLVANEFIKRRHDMSFVRDVVNDESQIPKILEKMQNKIDELGSQVAHEAKTPLVTMSPVSLPITPTAASNSTPTRVPRKIASKEPDKPRPGASKAPVCRTIRPMPRENHRENRSRAPKTRWWLGMGWSGE